jgi:hypothetical protein
VKKINVVSMPTKASQAPSRIDLFWKGDHTYPRTSIAGYSVGADEVFIYVRGEYHLPMNVITRHHPAEMVFLGENIFGQLFNSKSTS